MATKRRIPRPPLRVTLRTISPTSEGTTTKSIGDLIIEQVQKGVDPVNASGAVGVTAPELMAWMREGQLVRDRLAAGADWRKEFTPEQQDAALFAEALVKAHASHIAALSIVAEMGARGGLIKRRTVTRQTTNAAGVQQSPDVTETVETTLPDMDMVRWKLERLAPEVYGAKATLNVNVQDMTDTDATADTVEQHMREVAEQLQRAIMPGGDSPARDGDVIETTAVDDG